MKPKIKKMRSGPVWKCSFKYLVSFGATARQAFDNMIADINSRPEFSTVIDERTALIALPHMSCEDHVTEMQKLSITRYVQVPVKLRGGDRL